MKLTNEEKNKAVCGALGIHWHEWEDFHGLYCRGCHKYIGECKAPDNPDFSTDSGAVQLLRELKKKDWYLSFMAFAADNLLNEEYFELVTTPDLLLDKVVEWIERRGK